MRSIISRHTLCACLLALIFHAWSAAQQSGSVWDLGEQRAGAAYPTSIAATNECGGRRDFQIEIDDQASRFLKLRGSDRIEKVRRGESKAAELVVDLVEVAPGAYNDGRVRIRCLDCPPSCRQDVKTLEVKLVVLPRPIETTRATEPAAPAEAEPGQQPRETSRPTGRQPGEGTVAAAAGRACIVFPKNVNITSWDLMADLYRDGAMGKSPGSPRDYLNSIREDLDSKILAIEAMERDIGRVIDAYGGLEKYGIDCPDRTAGEPSFPPFPGEDFFVSVDLCQMEGDKRLADLIDPNADAAALEAWYQDFLRAFNNLGLKGGTGGSNLDYYDQDVQGSIRRLSAAASLFQERMEVSMALRLNRTAAWNKFVDAMATAAAVAISATTAGGGALAWAAAMGSGLQSFGLTEAARAASGGDPKAIAGAQIIGAIISLGTGSSSGIGAGFANSLQQELLTGVGIDAASSVATEGAKAQARNIALSMALLDDDVWSRQIAYLRDGVGYLPDGIAQFQMHRQELRDSVMVELGRLCAMRKTLKRILGPLKAAQQQAVARLQPQSWRDVFQEQELNCFCCKYSDGSGPDGACRFTIPAF